DGDARPGRPEVIFEALSSLPVGWRMLDQPIVPAEHDRAARHSREEERLVEYMRQDDTVEAIDLHRRFGEYLGEQHRAGVVRRPVHLVAQLTLHDDEADEATQAERQQKTPVTPLF